LAGQFGADQSDDVGLKMFAEAIVHFENKKESHKFKLRLRPLQSTGLKYNYIFDGGLGLGYFQINR
jgi:hypothetical protein